MAFRPSITREQWLKGHEKYRKVNELEEKIEWLQKHMQFTGLPGVFGNKEQNEADLQKLKNELLVECMKVGTTSRFL